jgi:hypothetical protein
MSEAIEFPDHFEQLKAGPIFIVGAARSGTTWVYDIMTAHPAVAGVYESWLFTPRDGVQSLFTPAHWPPGDSGLGRLLSREDLLAHTRQLTRSLLSRSIQPGHRFLVEKSPNHLFAMDFIQELFPDARFIHVLRDGRDVCVSVRAAAKSWGRQWQKSFGASVRSSARAWRDAVTRAHQDGARLNDHFLEIRYEDIHRDPRTAYIRLFDFCGIPYDESLLEDIFTATDFRNNFQADDAAFRRGGRTGDWRSYFSLRDAYMFHKQAGRKLMELGYEFRRHWWLRQFRPQRRLRPAQDGPASTS